MDNIKQQVNELQKDVFGAKECDTYIDENNTTWISPTAYAYYCVCKRVKELENELGLARGLLQAAMKSWEELRGGNWNRR